MQTAISSEKRLEYDSTTTITTIMITRMIKITAKAEKDNNEIT